MITYFKNVFVAFDMFLNAALGGVAGQTISMRAALAQKLGTPWACVFCRFLSWLVQRDHCQDQLTSVPMTDPEYAKAAGGLIVLAGLLVAPFYLITKVFFGDFIVAHLAAG